MALVVQALKNFSYPEDLKVRDKIRAFHKTMKNAGVGWDGDRGKIIEITAGTWLNAPEDLLDSWIAAELVLTEEETNDG